MLTPRYIWLKRMFPRKRYYAVLSSNPASRPDMFEPIRHIVDDYIYLNSQQRQFLLERGILEERIHHNPVYVNEACFYRHVCPGPNWHSGCDSILTSCKIAA